MDSAFSLGSARTGDLVVCVALWKLKQYVSITVLLAEAGCSDVVLVGRQLGGSLSYLKPEAGE